MSYHTPPTVEFKGISCQVKKDTYSNGRTSLNLTDEDGFPVATASVDLPEEPLEEDEVLIKDHSENQGMLETLQKAGIVSEPTEMVTVNHVQVPKCKLLM